MPSPTDPILLVSIPQYSPRCYRFKNEHIKIGRGKNNHLTLDNQAVSSTHCEFVKDPESGAWKFNDLKSTNGSRINGHKVGRDSVAVRDGDEILLGEEVKLAYFDLREFREPEADDDPNLEVNPVAAAVLRQVKEDQEGARTVKLKTDK